MAVEDVPTSNPLPPPPRRHGQGRGNQSARHENLSNADFRKMVIDTPRRVEETPKERPRKKKDEGEKRPPQRKFRPKPKEEEKREKREEPETPRYRDRAKERREDQNPDYELTAAGLGTLHAVAPPGVVDFRVAETPTISIANSKYLGGDVEHTHLVKGLDYALLNKVRSEIDKPVEEEEDDPEVEEKEKVRVWKDDEPVTFKSATAKLIHQWIVKPPNNSHKLNEMFLPGRTSFLFDMDEDLGHDIPTTLHRSKDDCPPAEEMVTVGIDASVLDRISKIMAYLRLGSSAKLLKKKKKDKGDSKVKGPVVLIEPIDTVAANADEEAAPAVNKQTQEVETATVPTELPPPPPPPPQPVASPPSSPPPPPPPSEISKEEEEAEAAAKLRKEEDDIFEGAGVEYEPTLAVRSPVSEDMEESPRDVGTSSYFGDPTVAPLPQNWPQPQQSGYEGAAMAAFPSEWQQYPSLPPESYVGPWPPEQQFPYPEQYYQNPGSLEVLVQPDKDPRFMSQEEKDRGMSSVFKRDDQRLQQRRELDSREKDPNFISESYSECYPGYQEYNREIVDSDEDEDLTKMDMGSRAKGRLHRWDFETEEEWAKYNEQKEAMPKAAFQFGVKMQDGRKTRKQNKDQKLNNDLHKINQILERKRKENGGGDGDGDGGGGDVIESESHPVKRIRV